MFRKLTVSLIALLIVALLVASVGCTQKETGSYPVSEPTPIPQSSHEVVKSPEPTPSQPEPPPSPVADLRIPGEITVYEIQVDSEIFEAHKVSADKGEATLFDVVRAVESRLGAKIPVISISQQKGMVVVDIAGRFVDDYDKANMYRILTTLAATLRENHTSFEWIQYRLDGETGVFGEQWEIPPLKLLEGSPEQFADIRAGIPYEGLQSGYYRERGAILDTDEKGLELAEFISMLGLFGGDVSVTELENQYVIEAALNATKHYSTYPGDPDYTPELKPFEAPAAEVIGFAEDWFWLKEHIAQSVKLLFGDYNLEHESCGKFRYIELLGAYTPPHMGGGFYTHPAIYGYEDLGDSYRVELAYILESLGGYFDPDAGWDYPVREDDLRRYVLEESKRREIILKKTGNGKYVFLSHKYL